jgi:hypothetical protein
VNLRAWRFVAVLAVAISIAVSAAAAAQTASPVPDPTQAAPPAPMPTAASAWEALEPWRTDRFFVETSVYTRHFHSDSSHDNRQRLILGEWNIDEKWLVGAAEFDNSFDQPCQYVYGGYRFRPFENVQPLYLKLTGGLLHGYKGRYRDNIPFNSSGVAPAILPALGYCLNRFCSELVLFGFYGTLVTVGLTIP